MQQNIKQKNKFCDMPVEQRRFFVDPKEIIETNGFKIGDIVADFGCGPGYFSIPAAERVGELGIVYAFDVLPQAIEVLESQIKIENIDNIITGRVNLEKEGGTGLASESVDWVIIKDVLFQNKNKDIILQEAKRILKSNGNILVMEWNENVSIGPSSKSRILKEELIKIICKEGFILKKEDTAGDYHYVIVAAKI
jgi:ubiquinone/menaquinone biosynthesis C-methylase UbiE